ncbi:hypothetical protein GCM10011369_07380 [Neiella marina]|uniref:Basic amino acid antiporter YfcC n=1 Tax=Neiella marina TaxID=508461 RepID=A0A8J2XMW8_9GAMM|nr:putative basic amino acid antiporter YfcC [Neiella marina]GGA68246.1 hypothetical protein GCM10011369_07380 [Neiella marina]
MKTTARQMPDAFVILFVVAVLAWFAGMWIPEGQYQTVEKTLANGSTRTVIDPDSYQRQAPELQNSQIPLFAEGGEPGLLNVPFEGLVSGSKWGSAIGVVAFILVVGGAFGIIMKTGAVDRGIRQLIGSGERALNIMLPVIFVLFSLGGAVFGMGEEAIAFCIILVPMVVALGFDSITAVLITYVATQIGFATSWMNPFSVAIAQGIADVPALSGMPFRAGCWLVFTGLGLWFTMRHAHRIAANPQSSPVYGQDDFFRLQHSEENQQQSFSKGDALVLLTLLGGIIWVIWGVIWRHYYIPEIASQFFTIGLLCGIIAMVFRLNGMSANDVADGFKQGAADLLPAALIVALAKGVLMLLGGDDATEPSALNTILHWAGQGLGEFSSMTSAQLMLLFQSVFNFFIASGSGQAALTMPLMAPLSDLVGVSRQISVLAFQLGDGLTNIIIPTSASLIGCLGVARIDWGVWFRFIWPLQLALYGTAAAAMAIAVLIDFT